MGVGSTLPPAPGAGRAQGDSFSEFQAQMPTRSDLMLRNSASSATQQLLDNPTSAFDAQAKTLKENFDANAAGEMQRTREEMIKGGLNSSQLAPALQDVGQQQILNRAGFARDMAGAREQARTENLGSAIASAMGIVNQGSQERLGFANIASQEKIAFADLSQREKQFARTAAQTDNELDFKKLALAQGATEAEAQRAWQASENAKSIGSQEKIAFADLSQREKQFARTAAQTDNELDFKKLALAQGATEAEAQRAWQSRENAKAITSQENVAYSQLSAQEKQAAGQLSLAKDRLEFDKLATQMQLDDKSKERVWQANLQLQDIQSREKIAGMQIGSTERLQATQLQTETAQKELDRILQSTMQKTGIDAQAAAQAAQNTFDTQMQAKGFADTKTIEAIRNNFQLQITQMGIDQETAMQASDQVARSLEAQRSRDFDAAQLKVQQLWTSAERVDSQDFQKNLQTSMQASEIRSRELLQTMEQTFLQGQGERQFGYQKALAAAEQAHDAAMQSSQNDFAAAQQTSSQVFQKELQAAGFTAQEAMQMTQIQAEASNLSAARDQQMQMFIATQAQEDAQFAASLGLDREKLNVQKTQFADQMSVTLQQMGLARDQWETAKANDQVDREMSIAMTGLQMWDGQDPSAIAPFAERLAVTMAKALGADPAQMSAAVKAAMGSGTTGAPSSTPATIDTVQSAGSAITDLTNNAKPSADLAAVSSMATTLASVITDPKNNLGGDGLYILPTGDPSVAYIKSLAKSLGYPSGALGKPTGANSPDISISPSFAAYATYSRILDSMAKPDTAAAFKIAAQAFGSDKMAAAYKQFTGKDWAR
jgi:hypothetical protein